MQKIRNGWAIKQLEVWFDDETQQAVVSEFYETSCHTYFTKQDLLDMLKLFEEQEQENK